MKKEKKAEQNNQAGNNAENLNGATFEVVPSFHVGDKVGFNHKISKEIFGTGPFHVICEPYESEDGQPYVKIKDEGGRIGSFPCSVIEKIPREHTDEEVIERMASCIMSRSCDGCPYENMQHDDCMGSLMLEVVGIAKKYKAEIETLKTDLQQLKRDYKIADVALQNLSLHPDCSKCKLAMFCKGTEAISLFLNEKTFAHCYKAHCVITEGLLEQAGWIEKKSNCPDLSVFGLSISKVNAHDDKKDDGAEA